MKEYVQGGVEIILKKTEDRIDNDDDDVQKIINLE